MTKLEGNTNDEKRRHRLRNGSSFGLGHSFVIPHSSFVIFFRLLFILLLLLEASCVPDRLRQANVDEVGVGMSRKQVESILGPPTETDAKDLPVTKTLIYLYRQRSGTVTIVFKEDKVAEKQSTLTR